MAVLEGYDRQAACAGLAKRCVLASPSGAFTGLAKRRIYWARQAAYLLGSPSGVFAGLAKRRICWARQAAYLLARQAAYLLASPSGMCWLQAKKAGNACLGLKPAMIG